jgi:hypothetical protein
MNSFTEDKTILLPLLIACGVACFWILPKAQAVVPAPDGCYPGLTTAEGCFTLFSLTTGQGNTAIGHDALFSDMSGSWNTGVGAVALAFNNGDLNTAVGVAALLLNDIGSNNTAVGFAALVSNNTGRFNTASGSEALAGNVDGNSNTASGYQALNHNTSGAHNTASGDGALFSNTMGNGNTATGFQALLVNTTGDGNTATGFQALFKNTGITANNNTANGYQALFNNTTANDNTAFGSFALFSNTGSSNVAIGHGALINKSTGDFNIALGDFAGNSLLAGSNNIYIGNLGIPGFNDSNTIRIGAPATHTKAFISGIHGVTTAGTAIPVLVDAAGQMGTMSSSQRFKDDIKPMNEVSEAILALKPVTFRYKSDSTGTPQFGLIAEEVAEVNPDLVVRDKDGEIYTVRYDQVNAMLLNEFLKEHKTVQEQGATIACLQKQIETLTAGLKKVSAQLELSKTAPQTVLNNR